MARWPVRPYSIPVAVTRSISITVCRDHIPRSTGKERESEAATTDYIHRRNSANRHANGNIPSGSSGARNPHGTRPDIRHATHRDRASHQRIRWSPGLTPPEPPKIQFSYPEICSKIEYAPTGRTLNAGSGAAAGREILDYQIGLRRFDRRIEVQLVLKSVSSETAGYQKNARVIPVKLPLDSVNRRFRPFALA